MSEPENAPGPGGTPPGALGEALRDYLKRATVDRGRAAASNPFDKFTRRARGVLTLAHEEARSLNHNYIGTEHLLLGLVAEGESVATQALANLGVEAQRVREAIEFIIGRGDRMIVGEAGLTPRAKRALTLAIDEARRLKHRYIGTEHLLLGLLQEGDGIAAKVLQSLGISIEQARAEVGRILGGTAPSPKSNVVMCRLDDRALDALDILIEAGVRTTRSEAVAWLVQAGIEANAPLFESVTATVEEIRRLRAEAQQRVQQLTAQAPPLPTDTATPETDPDAPPSAPSVE